MTHIHTLLLCVPLLSLACGAASKPVPATGATTTQANLKLGRISILASGSNYLSVGADGKVTFQGKDIGVVSPDGSMIAGGKVVATLMPDGSVRSDAPAATTIRVDIYGGITMAGKAVLTVDEMGTLEVAPGVPGGKLQYVGAKESYRVASFILALSLASTTKTVHEQAVVPDSIEIVETSDDLGPKSEQPRTDPQPLRKQIQEQIRSRQPQIRFCYEKQLAKNPSLAGTLRVKFTIGSTGEVADAQVASGFHDEVDSCVIAAIAMLVFPSRENAVTVLYPFVFKSE